MRFLIAIFLLPIVKACLPQNNPTNNDPMPMSVADPFPMPPALRVFTDGVRNVAKPHELPKIAPPTPLVIRQSPATTPNPSYLRDKLLGSPIVKQQRSDMCSGAYVIAITLMPYSPQTIGQNRVSLMKNLKLLESFTGTKMSSFGSYDEQPINYEGFFSMRYTMKIANDCEGMKNFATKAVSYSEDVERTIFMCKCGEIVMISKIRNKA